MSEEIRRPNIILITIDSLRADHVSCLGYSKKTTPNIDMIAKEGCLFSQAMANAPSTAYLDPPNIVYNPALTALQTCRRKV